MGDSHDGVRLDDYARVAKRYWWAILCIVVATTGAAFVFAFAQPHRYRATAKIMYIGPIAETTQLLLELNSVNTTITSPGVAARATTIMGRPLPDAARFTVFAAPLAMSTMGGAVGPLNPTRLVAVTAESGDATLAANLANAYAQSFVLGRTLAVRENARASVKVIRGQIAALARPEAQSSNAPESVTAAYVSLTQQLGELEATARQGNGGYILQVRAVPPVRPFSPQPIRSAITGLVIGLFLAIALAIFLRQFSVRVEDAPEVAALLGVPILGRVPHSSDTGRETGGLVTLTAPASSAAEEYRRLRASLSAVLAVDDVTTLLFASAHESEGASAALANIAVTLARIGRRVVVLDADLRSPRLHMHFGLPNDKGVTSVVTEGMSLDAALHTVDVALEGQRLAESTAATKNRPHASVQVLTSGPEVLDPGELVAGPGMTEIVAELKGSADVVLVDSPGLLDAADASSLAGVVDGLIFIVAAEAATRAALLECREYLDFVPCRQLGVVVTEQSRTRSKWSQRHEKQAEPVASEHGESAVCTANVSPEG